MEQTERTSDSQKEHSDVCSATFYVPDLRSEDVVIKLNKLLSCLQSSSFPVRLPPSSTDSSLSSFSSSFHPPLKVTGYDINRHTRTVTISSSSSLDKSLLLKTLEEHLASPVCLLGSTCPEERRRFQVEGITCGACVRRIEQGLKRSPAVRDVTVSLASSICTVKLEAGVDSCYVLEMLEALGYRGKEISSSQRECPRLVRRREAEHWRLLFLRSAALTFPAYLIAMPLDHLPSLHLLFHTSLWRAFTVQHLLLLLLCAPVQFGIGRCFYIASYKALRTGAANMDVLVALGTSAAFLYSLCSIVIACIDLNMVPHHFFETSAMLITFVLLGRRFEASAKGEASDAVSALMRLHPAHACILVPADEHKKEGEEEGAGGAGGAGREMEEKGHGKKELYDEERKLRVKVIGISELEVGDVVVVHEGERVPCDGVALQLTLSYVDESMVTGESKAKRKEEGDLLIGGSLVVRGNVEMRAARVGADSLLNQMVKLVEDAQATKAPMQLLADKIAARFVPFIVFLSLLTFSLWYTSCCAHLVPVDWTSIGGRPEPFMFAFLFANAVLVAACPCALGLATPTAVMVGTGVSARLGILIKSGAALEELRGVNVVVLDKTGTMTEGGMRVTGVNAYPTAQLDEDDNWVLQLAAQVEKASRSHHPIANAICLFAASARKIDFPDITRVEEKEGYGVQCFLGHRSVKIGSRTWMSQLGLLGGQQLEREKESEKGGCTTVCVSVEERLVGTITLADPIRKDAAYLVDSLQRMGVQVMIVSGDNKETCDYIGRQVGVQEEQIFSNVLPRDKSNVIVGLQDKGLRVAMVGDGINDSVALAQANVGIALGRGADVALEAADVVLVRNELNAILTAMDLSRCIVRRIQLNYCWAMGYNLVVLPLAAGALYPSLRVSLPPALAGLCMALSSVSVVLSSLMLRLYTPPQLSKSSSSSSSSRASSLCPNWRKSVRSFVQQCTNLMRGFKRRTGKSHLLDKLPRLSKYRKAHGSRRPLSAMAPCARRYENIPQGDVDFDEFV